MKTTVKVEGMAELDKTLDALGEVAAKRVLVRIGKKALQPVADEAYALAPDDPKTQGKDLKSSIGVGTQLSKNQAKLRRKAIRAGDEKFFAEVYAGAGPVPHAHLQEFGAKGDPPQPFMRPAWDSNKDQVLETIKRDLGDEIMKTARRQAARAAKLAAKG